MSENLVGLELRDRGFEVETVDLLVRVVGELYREPLLAVLHTLVLERRPATQPGVRLHATRPVEGLIADGLLHEVKRPSSA